MLATDEPGAIQARHPSLMARTFSLDVEFLRKRQNSAARLLLEGVICYPDRQMEAMGDPDRRRLGRRGARLVLGMWAAWSVVTLALAFFADQLPTPGDTLVHDVPLARWDASWYWRVATEGPRFDPAERWNSVVIYPLYPRLVQAIVDVLQTPFHVTGTVVSLVSLLGALLLLADLFCEDAGEDVALEGVACLLFFPTAFFFAAVYTESLFLLTTVTTFWAARRGWWPLAALAGALACLTRLNGAIVLLPLAWYASVDARRHGSIVQLRHLAALGTVLVAACIYPAYVWVRWNDALLVVHENARGWNRNVMPVWQLASNVAAEAAWRLRSRSGAGTLNFVTEIGTTLLFCGLTVVLFVRRRIAEGLYAAGTLCLYLNAGSLSSMPRYVLPLFPCFLVLATALRTRPLLAFTYIVAALGLGTTLLTRFVRGFWIA
jgi:hypothetical protein